MAFAAFVASPADDALIAAGAHRLQKGKRMTATATDERYARVLELLAEIEAGRKHTEDLLWANIPSWVDEFGQTNSDVNIDAHPAYLTPYLLTGILAITPTGATNVKLTIGSPGQPRTIPIAAGTVLLAPLGWVIGGEADKRNLSWTTTGAGFLALWGQQLPTIGKIT